MTMQDRQKETTTAREQVAPDRPASLGFLIWHLSQAFNWRAERALAPLSLTLSQHCALMVLRGTPGLSTAELARSCAVTAPAMGRATDELMRRSLIERHPHPTNRRILQLYATAEGIETAKRAMELLDPVEHEILRYLSDAERDLVRGLVTQMITSAAPYAHW